MPFVNYVEFSAPDVGAAADFYRSVFEWEPQAFAPEYLVVPHGDEPGIDIGIQRADGDVATTTAVVTVPSIDDTLGRVREAGGTVVVDKFEIPDVGHAAYFVDPSGRTVGVHEAPAD